MDAVIDTAHLDIYGMSISQKHYEKMKKTGSSYCADFLKLITN